MVLNVIRVKIYWNWYIIVNCASTDVHASNLLTSFVYIYRLTFFLLSWYDACLINNYGIIVVSSYIDAYKNFCKLAYSNIEIVTTLDNITIFFQVFSYNNLSHSFSERIIFLHFRQISIITQTLYLIQNRI